MSTATVERTRIVPGDRPVAAHRFTLRLLGAALALAIAYIHIKDQGGFPGNKAPRYVGMGYYLLELAALAVAVALLAGVGRHTVQAWLVAVGVAAGPLIGYTLSRGPGLPGYTDDRGNWSEPIGVASVVVEALLLLLAAAALIRARRSTPPQS
ncbi:MAG: hypothetical protein ABJC62_01615 [Frankiaceae bacterium]